MVIELLELIKGSAVPLADKLSECLTAWDTFSDGTPGQSSRVDVNGLSVYDLPEELKDWGIYFCEQREED